MITSRAIERNIGIKDRYWFSGFVLCLCLVAFTGLRNTTINTFFLGLYLFLVVTSNKTELLSLFLISSTFFGYSKVSFVLVGGFAFANSTMANLLSVVIVVRLMSLGMPSKLPFKMLPTILLVMYSTISALIGTTILSGIALLCSVVVVVNILMLLGSEETENKKLFVICYAGVVLAEIIYGLLFNNDNSKSGWRLLQFSGTLDPNNMAIRCNYLLALLILMRNCFDGEKLIRVLQAILIVVVICTLSFSGITTMLSIIAVSLIISGGNSAGAKIIYTSLVLVVVLLVYSNQQEIIKALKYSDVEILRGWGERLSTMTKDLKSGEMSSFSSGRTDLWEIWMKHFNEQDLGTKLFGSTKAYARIKSITGYSSHNSYIDFLVQYGIVGMTLYVFKAGQSIVHRLRKEEYLSVIFTIIMMINLFARTVGLQSALLYSLFV